MDNVYTKQKRAYKMSSIKRSARFTLIELLIVISIIAILASLLLTAMSRVKYKAKLVVCANNLKEVGMTAVIYAENNNQSFPYRPYTFTTTGGSSYRTPYIGYHWAYPASTDIPVFKELGLDGLPCPFNEKMRPGRQGLGYSYYFGWTAQQDASAKDCSLLKLNKVMTFQGNEFDVIASDVLHTRSASLYLGHPDYGTGILTRNTANPWSNTWSNEAGLSRGPVDLNFGKTDGSVELYNRIKAGVDPRMKKLPYKNAVGVSGTIGYDYNLAPPK